MTNMLLPKIFYVIFLVFFSYFIVFIFNYLFLVLVGILEEKKRRLEGQTEDYSLSYFSSFSLPVSIIIPARNEEEWIKDSLLSAVNINYPEFEVIIVDDGSTDNTLKILSEILKLKSIDAQYTKHYKDGIVNEILRSDSYPNVTVIAKSAGVKKAGAVNAGLNMAKYSHVCVMDADTVLERDALLKVMAYIEKDPERIIGIGSYFGISNGMKIKNGVILEYSFSYNPIVAYQNLEYIRSFFGNRIAWSKFNSMPNVAGGFGIWRRDVLYDMGGYSAEFTCEDIELTFRAHDYMAKHPDKHYEILMLPNYVSWTEGPSNMKSLISQRARWQRVVNETVWSYKYMLFNPRYKAFGFLALPYHLVYEVLGAFFEAASIAFVAWGCIAHVLDTKIFLAYFCLMIFAQTFVSLLSLFAFLRNQKFFKFRYLLYLIGLTFVEFFWYKWLLSVAKVAGTIQYFKGNKTYDQYVREKRKDK
jgi:cellulose synthase/poly-beta-1,6-N-acetylglucosamine synthase-like glycosyltransferase